MAQLTKKPQVSVITKEIVKKDIITKNGECKVHISLDLNINLNSNGLKVDINEEEKGEEEIQSFVLPEFKMEKVKFGEKV